MKKLYGQLAVAHFMSRLEAVNMDTEQPGATAGQKPTRRLTKYVENIISSVSGELLLARMLMKTRCLSKSFGFNLALSN